MRGFSAAVYHHTSGKTRSEPPRMTHQKREKRDNPKLKLVLNDEFEQEGK